jgi:hypothetical protein
MNRGKRYIRNTVIALFGLTVLFVAASRLYASVVKPDSPPWLRTLVSLGQSVQVSRQSPPQLQAVRVQDAGGLHFSRISVEGDFAVEVVAAPVHKVSLAGYDGQSEGVEVQGQRDGLLLLKGMTGSEGAVLRIETPAIAGVEARYLRQLTLRGFKAAEVSISTRRVSTVLLEENDIGHWNLNSETPVVVKADRATVVAGMNIRGRGVMTLESADGKTINFMGSGAHDISLGAAETPAVRFGK